LRFPGSSRNGPVSGKYFQGELDDTPIWNVVRSASDIGSTVDAA